MEHSQGSGRHQKRQRSDSREFRSDDGSFGLVIGNALLMKMKESCARAHPLETGGVLIGRYNEGHDTALVSRAIGPPSDSKSSLTTFLRGSRGLHGLLNRLWTRKEYYLGEWHYHPSASAQPSVTDSRQMQVIARDDDTGCPEPVLIILRAEDAITVHVFPRGQSTVQLTPENAYQPYGDLE